MGRKPRAMPCNYRRGVATGTLCCASQDLAHPNSKVLGARRPPYSSAMADGVAGALAMKTITVETAGNVAQRHAVFGWMDARAATRMRT